MSMAHVRLPFQPQWRLAVLAGTKTTTVRTKRFGEAGDTFEVDAVTFEIVESAPMTLERARDTLWREEGMRSPEEFEKTWKENHPARGFAGRETVWAHRFRRAPR